MVFKTNGPKQNSLCLCVCVLGGGGGGGKGGVHILKSNI